MGTVTDYPTTLAAAHGRIAAYRYVLQVALAALDTAEPYVANVARDPATRSRWRETAEASLAEIHEARNRCAAELSVTNP